MFLVSTIYWTICNFISTGEEKVKLENNVCEEEEEGDVMQCPHQSQ